MELPRFIALRSTINNKYLRYVEIGGKRGFLQFSGESVLSPYSKFEVERATCGGGLVHLRCCYNNKYFVASGFWIVAEADQPDEDSQKSRTLFQPQIIFHAENGDARLDRAVRFGLSGEANNYVGVWHGDSNNLCPQYEFCLLQFRKISNDGWSFDCVSVVFDWEASLLVLPKHVAFKGENGRYLSARWIEKHQYLQFASSDKGDTTVGSEVTYTPDGRIRIKSDHFGKFWRRSPNWIWADSNDTSGNNRDTLFSAIKIDNKTIALRNLGNNNFCKSLTTEGKVNCLNAAVPTISRDARLEVEELVFSRAIYDVDFDLMDARIYNQSVIAMDSGVAVNTTLEPSKQQLSLSYTETESRTWKSSVSWKLGAESTIKTKIPFLAQGHITLKAEFANAYEWGTTLESSTKRKTLYEAVVPPMTRVTIALIATMGSCDVPFSYTQRDTLYNGQQVSYRLDDGLYTGINSFNFKFEHKEEKLPSAPGTTASNIASDAQYKTKRERVPSDPGTTSSDDDAPKECIVL